MFNLLRSSISGYRLSDEERERYSSERLHSFLKMANKHDVIHLLALGIKQNKLVPKVDVDVDKFILKAVYRYERTRYDFDNLCIALEKAQVAFLPLKGSVIRQYYPEEWMRTSCDIDILVHEEDLEKVKSVMIDQCGYKYRARDSHEISLFSPTNVHVELHYNLVEEGIANKASDILRNVWNSAKVHQGFSFWYKLPDDLYYFYHIAHMAKHFENGGCGIRPFVDLWILDNLKETYTEKRNFILEKGELLKFANVARKLSRVWFAGEEYDFSSKRMEDYILRGGVYGNCENRVMIQQQLKGGKLNYVMARLFMPYDMLKNYYPILKKHKWLFSFMQVRRWISFLLKGNFKRGINEVVINQTIEKSQAKIMSDFLKDVGL